MSDPLETLRAIEIATTAGSYWTNQYDSIVEVKSAIDRGDTIRCWWFRADGCRFEEDFIFLPDSLKLVMTNRS